MGETQENIGRADDEGGDVAVVIVKLSCSCISCASPQHVHLEFGHHLELDEAQMQELKATLVAVLHELAAEGEAACLHQALLEMDLEELASAMRAAHVERLMLGDLPAKIGIAFQGVLDGLWRQISRGKLQLAANI